MVLAAMAESAATQARREMAGMERQEMQSHPMVGRAVMEGMWELRDLAALEGMERLLERTEPMARQ
jgi:hypothetical protein